MAETCKEYNISQKQSVTQSKKKKNKPGPLQTSKMVNFATIFNGYKPLTTVANLAIVDIWRVPGYGSEVRMRIFDAKNR